MGLCIKEFKYTYKDIVKALVYKAYFSPIKGKFVNPLLGRKVCSGADWENNVIESIDATRIVKTIKNVSRRIILIYKAVGFTNKEIALKLGISERMVDKHISWIKKYIKGFGKSGDES